jgi:hypothetical protein
MREHRAVLQALSRSQPADAAPVPVTMRVLEVIQAD